MGRFGKAVKLLNMPVEKVIRNCYSDVWNLLDIQMNLRMYNKQISIIIMLSSLVPVLSPVTLDSTRIRIFDCYLLIDTGASVVRFPFYSGCLFVARIRLGLGLV